MENLLLPMLALVCWTLLIWIWMYVKRIPAMNAAGLKPDEARHPGSLDVLPTGARAAADNYNHLHEQPTIFYALIAYIMLADTATGGDGYIAWAYVGLRVMHSLVQISCGPVALRFPLFALSTLMLMILAFGQVMLLL